MLVLDAFKGHVTDSVKDQLHRMKTELVIPGGMTSVLQPMDVSINPLAPELFFKFLHTLYLKCE
jgi:hypothetical protein